MADSATPPRPTGPTERIDAIDVLRGLALLGVVAMNVVTIFRVSIFEQFLFPTPALSFSSIDSAIETILTGGDDFEVVATIPPRKLKSFASAAKRAGVKIAEIGSITKGSGARFFGADKRQLRFARTSFSHF